MWFINQLITGGAHIAHCFEKKLVGFFSSGLWETSTCNAPSLGFLMPKTIKVLRLIDVDSFYDWFCQLAVESFNALARSLMKFHICAVLLCGPLDHGGELLHFLGFIMMVNDWPCSGVWSTTQARLAVLGCTSIPYGFWNVSSIFGIFSSSWFTLLVLRVNPNTASPFVFDRMIGWRAIF